jgi:hypothetical protein
MNRTLLVIVALCVAGASAAQDVKPSTQDARASMPYLGTAAMSDDGTLSLHLRATSDGKPASDTLTYKVTDRAYDNILRHLGGLNPGDTKEFRPWKD